MTITPHIGHQRVAGPYQGVASYTDYSLTLSKEVMSGLAVSVGYVGTDASRSRQGTIATLESELRWQPVDRLTLTTGPGLMWTNGRYAQTLYGIDAAQSARSGLPAYHAGAGLGAAYWLAGARWRIDNHWQLMASAAIERLAGDARDSPIVRKSVQTYFMVGTAYRF